MISVGNVESILLLEYVLQQVRNSESVEIFLSNYYVGSTIPRSSVRLSPLDRDENAEQNINKIIKKNIIILERRSVYKSVWVRVYYIILTAETHTTIIYYIIKNPFAISIEIP